MACARWLAVMLVTVAIACPSSRACAEPAPAGDLPPAPPPPPLAESLSGDAKREYDTALLLYETGDFQGAESRFLSGYELSKDARLLWNAAACAQSSRHYARAIALVRRYLDSRSPLITPGAARNARAFLEAALPLTAKLVVESNEPEISVYLDDEHLGALPLDPNTRVDFGTHRLLLTKPGFAERRESFTVTGPADVHVKVQLHPVVHQGRLVVRAGQRDSISLNGRFVGVGSFDGAMPSGAHILRVSAPGLRTFESRVLVEDDRTRAIDVALEAAPVSTGLRSWVWAACGAVLVAGAGTAAYFMFRPSDEPRDSLPVGSAGKVQLPFR